MSDAGDISWLPGELLPWRAAACCTDDRLKGIFMDDGIANGGTEDEDEDPPSL
eukprot:CAMPEP_0171921252 /NCGR_PEP_ID=MMETSP0993-20121228/20071_1 /TAXON_ID=483369 /ORGANISM="non described non described, Strain CCMP2098" /LENGTH=52 /DNA_ID=CAMNT_0012558577 /DNA_START=132 /DNA_END=287 /DNA_ORIENTATION=-